MKRALLACLLTAACGASQGEETSETVTAVGGAAQGGAAQGGAAQGGAAQGGAAQGGAAQGGAAQGGAAQGGAAQGGAAQGGAAQGGAAQGGAAQGGAAQGGAAQGGAAQGGAAQGGAAQGGGTGSDCVWEEGPSATNGSLTCYWFAQGTARDETTCPGGYKTYCGYCGSEQGERPQDEGQNWCPINDVVSTVAHISTEHFVALPPTHLAAGQMCGMCVEVTYRNRTIVATAVDSCPSCTTDAHIDLNLSAAAALGMTETMGQVESGVTWRAVGCPTTEDIQVSFNGGYKGQVYFQNAAFPIATASSGERVATVNTGFWDFGMEMGGQPVTLTDVMGHTVSAVVPNEPGSLGVQFELSCL